MHDQLLVSVNLEVAQQDLLHLAVDFQRVDENRKIHVKVPLHFINGEISPAVKLNGAIVSHVTTELDISCLPKDLPEFIEVDLAELDVGHSIHVSALKLPPGVAAVPHKTDPVVATAVVPRAQVETDEELAAAAAAAETAAAAAAVAPAEGEAKPAAAEKGAEKKDEKKDDKKK